ncbi:MAG TPA: hypothetical protein ENF17_07145, partial [Candidatus Aminicenantes bacterium]|nr:hypothetical protein [Candidatus Aminicenantes bacterium]
MKWSRRSFLRNLSLGFFGAGLTKSSFPSVSPPLKKEDIKGDSAKLLVKSPDHPQPAPKGVDRLPLSWYQKRVKRLKERVGERDVDVIVLEDSWNMTYFSGCFLTKTERPCWCVFPVAEEDIIYWFSPGLDNELVKSWWCTEMNYYYDYPHAKGGYPDKGKVVKGYRVDLFEWFLEGMKKKGFADKTFGFDSEFTPSRMKKFKKVLPKAKVVDISDICMKKRMVKTPEEIALIQRAMNYFSQIHAFGRDYLLT